MEHTGDDTHDTWAGIYFTVRVQPLRTFARRRTTLEEGVLSFSHTLSADQLHSTACDFALPQLHGLILGYYLYPNDPFALKVVKMILTYNLFLLLVVEAGAGDSTNINGNLVYTRETFIQQIISIVGNNVPKRNTQVFKRALSLVL
jgi:hypothetical protein